MLQVPPWTIFAEYILALWLVFVPEDGTPAASEYWAAAQVEVVAASVVCPPKESAPPWRAITCEILRGVEQPPEIVDEGEVDTAWRT